MALNGDVMLGTSVATWDDGENTLEISVTNGSETSIYTVIVTKS